MVYRRSSIKSGAYFISIEASCHTDSGLSDESYTRIHMKITLYEKLSPNFSMSNYSTSSCGYSTYLHWN